MDKILGSLLILILISCGQVKERTEVKNDEVLFEEEVAEEIELQEAAMVEEVVFSSDPSGWISFPENDFQHLDIRYATDNNFVDEVLYECGRCFLRTEVAEALNKVAQSLAQIDYRLVLYDCYRPKPIQQKLWDKVPNPSYVTPPHKGSMHNRGAAVDLSIMNDKGEYLNMGTEYDFFGKEAHTDNFDLPEEVLKNRKLLNDLMVKYGFKGIRTEWWHFSFVDGSYEIADWEWECQ